MCRVLLTTTTAYLNPLDYLFELSLHVWSCLILHICGVVSLYICGVVSLCICICGVVLLHMEVLEYRETEVIVLCRYKPPILIAVSSCLQQSSLIYTSAVSASTLRHTTELTAPYCLLFTYNLQPEIYELVCLGRWRCTTRLRLGTTSIRMTWMSHHLWRMDPPTARRTNTRTELMILIIWRRDSTDMV